MKRSAGLKWITVIILLIAATSLVFGSFIMLLGAGDKDQAATSSKTPINAEVE
jgi:hypothetical protein